MIRTCSCNSKYQDRLYGPGKRVFNECKAGQGGQKAHRCTVCGREDK